MLNPNRTDRLTRIRERIESKRQQRRDDDIAVDRPSDFEQFVDGDPIEEDPEAWDDDEWEDD